MSRNEEGLAEDEVPAKVSWSVSSDKKPKVVSSAGRSLDDIGTVQEESPPFKALKSPGQNSNAKSTMQAWLNMIVPLKMAKPLAAGIPACKIDNQTNIEDLDKTIP